MNRMIRLLTVGIFTATAFVLTAGCTASHVVSGTQRQDIYVHHDSQRMDVHIHRDGKTWKHGQR